MSTHDINTGSSSLLSRMAWGGLLALTIASSSGCMAESEMDLAETTDADPRWSTLDRDERRSALLEITRYDAHAGVHMASVADGTTCVVTMDGDAKCWGHNDAGQLGRGDDIAIGDDETPDTAEFIHLGGEALEIHTNGEQTYALLASGVVRAWGANEEFDLGLQHSLTIGDDEAPGSTDTPVDVDVGAEVEALAVGLDFACALLDGGAVRCWGANDFGQLGYGHTERIGDDESPAQAGDVDLGGVATQVVAGKHHACARLESGAVRCWGSGALGQLGDPNGEDIGDDETPGDAQPLELGAKVLELAAGGDQTCAVLEDGNVRCWGDDDDVELGGGSKATFAGDRAVGTLVTLPEPALSVAAGERHACALLETHALYCWGDGQDGQLGYGSAESIGDDESPDSMGPVDLGGRVVQEVFIGSTASSTCVRLVGDDLRCWGSNSVGQLGLGHTLTQGNTPNTAPSGIDDVLVYDDTTH